jgi:hypothetical protein
MEPFDFTAALGLFLLSSVKFFFSPGAAVAAGYGFWQSVVITTGGGAAGVCFFYYGGGWAFRQMSILFGRWLGTNREKKVFTRRNRIIVNVKLTFGMIGIALLTPSLLSIPIGAVVMARMYGANPYSVPLLLGSVVLWSVGLTAFSLWVKAGVLAV